MGKLITDPDGKKAQSPTSHNKMNKDKANTPAGRLAEKVATEEALTVYPGRQPSPKTGNYPNENTLRKEQGKTKRVNYGF